MTEKYTPAAGDYLTLQNKKYLPARRRVQWFRGEHPDWAIDTAVIELDWADGHAVIRAEVRDEQGRVIASGMKSETRKGFPDFVEKAETGAIARAVAIAGYGTEDALDLDEALADSPVEPRSKVAAPDSIAVIRERVIDILHERHLDADALQPYADKVGIVKGERATLEQWQQILALIERRDSDPAAEPVTEVALSASAMPPAPSIEAGQSADVEAPPASGVPGSSDPASTPDELLAATVATTGGTVIPAETAERIERARKRGEAAIERKARPAHEQEPLDMPV